MIVTAPSQSASEGVLFSLVSFTHRRLVTAVRAFPFAGEPIVIQGHSASFFSAFKNRMKTIFQNIVIQLVIKKYQKTK